MWPFRSLERKIDDFWAWFSVASKDINFSARKEPIAGISARLRRVHKGLVWGMEVRDQEGAWTLEVSADGNPSLRELVRTVVRRAPRIQSGRIVAFRQPSRDGVISFQGKELAVDDCRYAILVAKDGTQLLQVYLPVAESVPDDVLAGLGFLVLDHAFGEEWVMNQIVIPFKSVLLADKCFPLRDLQQTEMQAGRIPIS